ncbi:nucleoside/nucleotide kinase family protein [uncultured Roseobacter sp.]|uniref:nucleoside/nucleotide kinase family protein n=1 Tax=uncultured Roseobacter sp. TaxID=114847 RepID=UPI0026292B34|nr:nucleoside/nucleotide kinase family protein [uncultured Roseobacter sp.]
MKPPGETAAELAPRVLGAPRRGRRRLVALAGQPASGKTTLAESLAAKLCEEGCNARVVPMDGFHLHNQILLDRDILNRKGAPHTFDAAGFVHLISRLHDEEEVFYPLFDRSRDISVACAGRVGPECDTVVIEGNYLLYDAPVWRDLSAHWDMSVRLDISLKTLEERLVQRWLDHGLSAEQAAERAAGNDLANARSVAENALPADIVLTG